jgi:1-acyl-sn-glycerol-3-phosphate acyltransferase
VIVIRSVVFNLLFYLNLILYVIAALPTLVMPRWGIIALAKSWGRTSNRLLRLICGITVEYRGLDRIPPGALIVAAKHQSVWETFTLITLLDDPTYILKRELTWIPVFGWYLCKAGMIPVNRGARGQALADMTERARFELARGRQIIIFPEGTRRPPGAEPAYKFGVVNLYAETAARCLPVALNSGLFWPRRKFLRYPGTIILQVLEVIPPGLDRETFAARLEHDIESATARLIEEGKRNLPI